ncbi:MAG: glycerol-3-phosphate acyltransferase, partial [Ruminococcus sp.]|nr:glycerol-3-phosphate acyltransferase [Ruminococcus sp.]
MDPVIGVITSTFGTYWWVWLLTAVIAYLIGSVNPAVIVTKIWTKGKKDIRDMGSGNAGFTNVLRSVGKVPAIITIVCDALKCVAAVLIGGLLFTLIAGDSSVSPQVINVGKYLAGIFCILGHSFPLYFHFKGGKGVVSAAALMLTEDWRVFLMVLATFLILFLISKIISLGSIAGAVLYGPYTFIATFLFDRLVYGDN